MTLTVPKVSVVLATRNAAGCLAGALESVDRQKDAAVEVVVMDGASTDGTLEILRSASSVDRWSSAPDRGIYDAYAKGVAASRGAWVLFLGADDRLCDGFGQLLPLLTDPSVIYYGDVILSSSGRRHAGAFDAAKLARTNICQQAIFYPRAAFARHAFSLDYTLQADWAFNMACWSDPDLRFQYVSAAVATFNDRDGLSSRKTDWAFWWDYGCLLRRHLPPNAIAAPLAVHALSRLYRLVRGPAAARRRKIAFSR